MTLKEKLSRTSNYFFGFPKTKQDKKTEYFFREWTTGEESKSLLKAQRFIQQCDFLAKTFLNTLYVSATIDYFYSENCSTIPYLATIITSLELGRYISDFYRKSATEIMADQKKEKITNSLEEQV